MQWMYRMESNKSLQNIGRTENCSDTITGLNILGKEGWELCCCDKNEGYWLKRLVPSQQEVSGMDEIMYLSNAGKELADIIKFTTPGWYCWAGKKSPNGENLVSDPHQTISEARNSYRNLIGPH